jgi:hypothetical protein
MGGNGSRQAERVAARFECEVRRWPAPRRAAFWVWLRGWRRRPGRVFWVMDGEGNWRRL